MNAEKYHVAEAAAAAGTNMGHDKSREPATMLMLLSLLLLLQASSLGG